MNFLQRIFGKSHAPAERGEGRVTFDEVRVEYVGADGKQQHIAWGDLVEVSVLTTNEGPFIDDVFFFLLGPTSEQGICVPQGATGSQQLVERLVKLPDFDDSALINAMRSTDNNRFICWKNKIPKHLDP